MDKSKTFKGDSGEVKNSVHKNEVKVAMEKKKDFCRQVGTVNCNSAWKSLKEGERSFYECSLDIKKKKKKIDT